MDPDRGSPTFSCCQVRSRAQCTYSTMAMSIRQKHGQHLTRGKYNTRHRYRRRHQESPDTHSKKHSQALSFPRRLPLSSSSSKDRCKQAPKYIQEDSNCGGHWFPCRCLWFPVSSIFGLGPASWTRQNATDRSLRSHVFISRKLQNAMDRSLHSHYFISHSSD